MSELWDCYDSNFNKIKGKVLTRGEESSFSNEEYHLVCEVAVRHTDGTFLLMQRDFHKELLPGLWEFTAGGSALQGENPLQCAKRELYEETGIIPDTLYEVGRLADKSRHSHYFVYFATVSCDKDSVSFQEGETVAYKWVEKSEVLAMKDRLATWRIFEMLPELDVPKYSIKHLPKERWENTPIYMVTKSDSYYDVEITPMNESGCNINLVRKQAEKEIVHTPEEYDFPDKLYQPFWEDAEVYGIVGDNNELLACIEVCPEDWSNRLMVTELWIGDKLRKKVMESFLWTKPKK